MRVAFWITWHRIGVSVKCRRAQYKATVVFQTWSTSRCWRRDWSAFSWCGAAAAKWSPSTPRLLLSKHRLLHPSWQSIQKRHNSSVRKWRTLRVPSPSLGTDEAISRGWSYFQLWVDSSWHWCNANRTCPRAPPLSRACCARAFSFSAIIWFSCFVRILEIRIDSIERIQ